MAAHDYPRVKGVRLGASYPMGALTAAVMWKNRCSFLRPKCGNAIAVGTRVHWFSILLALEGSPSCLSFEILVFALSTSAFTECVLQLRYDRF